MSDQTVIITGASRGLGAATAKITAKLGAEVVLNARSEDDLNEVAAEIRESGGQALVVPGDVSHVEDCWRLVNKALREYGRVDTIVNNAGIIEPIAPIAQGDPQMWRANVEINILGPVYLTQAALPHLRKRNGRVINVSSGAAVKVVEGWAAYCATKAALNHFTRVLAAEEAAVTAIAFRPGVVDTELQATIRAAGEEGMPAENYEHYVRLHQEGKLLPPELPGRSLAALSLYAPPSWSGEFISWDEERVRSLIN
jgi:NAD(P)-dependent dehydrogenase (short-subunit alcohol dehydrogenase family)